MKIENVNVANLKPADWSTTHILTPDLKLLVKSMQDFGWICPIVARSEDGTIIDGFSRWHLASTDKVILARDRGIVPVHWVACSELTAKIMHIRMNRARGSIAVQRLAKMIQSIIDSGEADESQLASILSMTLEEVYTLSQPALIKARKLSEHVYSSAWVPVEVPSSSSTTVVDMEFERPPTPDH